MVLHVNVCLNQRVELKQDGRIYSGTVKFKGCLNGIPGDWVGLALDENVGRHDGMIKGRRYFSCCKGHGLFVPASKLRFVRTQRYLHNAYRTLEAEPEEEDLFGMERPESSLRRYGEVSRSYENLTDFNRFSESPTFHTRPRTAHLGHTVSRSIPAATMLRPETARRSYTYTSRPIHTEYEDAIDDWISSPSIPQTHMPYNALKSQMYRGWETPHQHYPRHWPVHTARESVKWDKWNDVSY